jgi:hypothetical protein
MLELDNWLGTFEVKVPRLTLSTSLASAVWNLILGLAPAGLSGQTSCRCRLVVVDSCQLAGITNPPNGPRPLINKAVDPISPPT